MKVAFVGVLEAVKHLDEYIDAHWTVPPQDKDETDPLLFPISTLAEALETEWIKSDMHQDEHSRVAAADLEKSGGLFLGHGITFKGLQIRYQMELCTKVIETLKRNLHTCFQTLK